MNTENVWIVIVLLVLILGGANGMVYVMLRGMRKGGGEIKWLSKNPWQEKGNEMTELHKRVQALKEMQDEEPPTNP
jgi:hypothetical protein